MLSSISKLPADHWNFLIQSCLKKEALNQRIANQLGMDEAAKLLHQTLQEEKQTDELLCKIAISSVNKRAA